MHVWRVVVPQCVCDVRSSEKNEPATLKHGYARSVCIHGIWLVRSFHLIRGVSASVSIMPCVEN